MAVYFVQSVDGGAIKIGTSRDVPLRIKQLEADYARPLAILGTMPGGREEEREIHERFSHLRFGRSEQFRPEPDLLAFIGRPLFVSAVPVVEAMPNVGRVTLVNLKGTEEEREWLQHLSRVTGVTLSEIARRGVALFAVSRGVKPPDGWVIE